MKILFVMDTRVDRGSIQAAANYVRVAEKMGHVIAIYGHPNPDFPSLRFSADIHTFDYVVFIIEGWRRWMSGLRVPRVLSAVPRERRAILDTDGMYNQAISVDSYDFNYLSEQDRSEWLAHYRLLADRILQPTLAPHQPGVRSLPFYGYDADAQVSCHTSFAKRFDILQVGHNWWRWRQVSESLLPAIEKIRPQLGEICFVGLWWDAPPSRAGGMNFEAAFCVDPERLRRLQIEVKPPVPYTQVIPLMSEGRINVMTQRPLFRHFKLLTSKYFEIVSADTIPLVMLDPAEAESVYGPAGRELALHGGVADKLLDALHHTETYRQIAHEVRRHLLAHHSYFRRVQELVEALQT